MNVVESLCTYINQVIPFVFAQLQFIVNPVSTGFISDLVNRVIPFAP